MPTDHRTKLAAIKRFDQLIAYLRDEMGWPIGRDSFEDVDDLFYDFTADELGIDPTTAAKIQEIKRLRPLSAKQPWGIFFVKFEPKKLPVVALRRILSQVALKKRSSANSAERAAWAADDLLFISNYGVGEGRQISFAHFSRADDGRDLPTLKVLGWDNRDTAPHLDAVARELSEHLAWPNDDNDVEAWRQRWRAAFTLGVREVVTTSKELSIRLAELARAIRDRIKTALAIETDKGPLTKLMSAFRASLVHDLDADGFADTYAQTIAYGLLSSRIANPKGKTADDFAAHMRTNPFLRELMETFLRVGGRRGKAGGPGIDFDELGVSEVIELLDAANMEAVVRDFGDRNRLEDPVIHFYVLFLSAYDKELKVQRGVFYTPQPIVSYIVGSAHEVLRSEFGLEDGLADTATWGDVLARNPGLKLPLLTDESGRQHPISPTQPFVQILDPATGTATFLVEIIDVVFRTLASKWNRQGLTGAQQESAWNDYVPKHLLPRLYAFEIMMAPYAIAHMKIGLKLAETGYRFGSEERARIYLTNTLEPHQDLSGRLVFDVPALAHEAEAVNRVKANAVFTVVVGNPPYLREKQRGAGERGDRIGGWVRFGDMDGGRPPLLDDFIKPLAETNQGIHAKLAYELSVMFWRFALWTTFERRASVGIIGMISPRAYISGPGHAGMRKWIRGHATEMWITDLGGDNRGARKSANVFEIETGVAIGVCVKSPKASSGPCRVHYGEIEGSADEKLAMLQKGPHSSELDWQECALESDAFMPSSGGSYADWPKLTDLFPWQHSGVQFKRLWPIAESREMLERRWKKLVGLPASERGAAFVETDARVVRGGTAGARTLRCTGIANLARTAPPPQIQRYSYRSFDRQWAFVDERLADRLRPSLVSTLGPKQVFAMTLMSKQLGQGPAVAITSCLPDMDAFCNRGAKDVIPLWRDALAKYPNVSLGLLEAISHSLGAAVSAEELFCYCAATLGGPSYTAQFDDELATPGPRIPIALDAALFKRGVQLGAKLVWLQTYGERWLLLGKNPDKKLQGSAKIEKQVPDDERNYPTQFSFDATSGVLAVGGGVISGVAPEVFGYSQSGFKPVESWLRYRMKERAGRAARAQTRSELDLVRPRSWTFTQELLELLWVVEGCVRLWPSLEEFLGEVVAGQQILANSLPLPAEVERSEPSGNLPTQQQGLL